MFELTVTRGQIKVASNVLSNLAAGWIGSIVILPGFFGIKSIIEAILLLTYSLLFATLAMVFAAKLEDKYL